MCFSACIPISLSFSGVERSSVITEASVQKSSEGNILPVTPFTTVSGNPPLSEIIAGQPQACASIETLPKDSVPNFFEEGKTARALLENSFANSF